MNEQPTGFPHRRLLPALALVALACALALGDFALKSDRVQARGAQSLQPAQPLLANDGANVFSPFLTQTNNNLQWTQTAGPYGGFVTAFGLNGPILFAGTEGAGVFRSTDSGQNWTPASNGLTNRTIRAFTVNGTNLFAGTEGGGVYRSSDNGANWTQVNNGLANTTVRALAVSGTALLAGTTAGIFSSSNNGQSWSPLVSSTNVTSLVVSGSTVYVGTEGAGILRSVNSGIYTSLPNAGLTNPFITALTVSGASLFAGTNTGVFRFSENNQNWTRVNTGLTSTVVRAFAVGGTNLFAATDGGVFRSANAGDSWTAVSTGLTNSAVRALAVSEANLFAGTFGGGVFRSGDSGATWTPVSNGIVNTLVRAFVASGANLFAATEGAGVFRSGDNGQTWTQVNNGLTNTAVRALAVSGTTLFAGTQGSGVFRSSDNGQSWIASSTGLTSLVVRSFFVNGTTILAGTDGNVFRSTDNGQTWAATSPLAPILNVEALLVSGTSIFAGTEGNGAFRSTNEGLNWTPVLAETNIRTLTLTGTNIFAGTGGGVYLSTDNGLNWRSVSTGLTNANVRAFAVSGTSLFAGTDGGGVYRSINAGQTWSAINSGLSDTTVRALIVNGTNLIAGTAGSGAFAASLSDCVYAISPGSQAFGIEGGAGSVAVVTASGCEWTAVSNANWIVINSGASGLGAGSVSYTVDANTSASARTGTVAIAGKSFTVTQPGVVSNPVPTLTGVTPNTVTASAAGFTLSLTGGNFNGNSRVQWNGFDRPTTFVSTTQLTAEIPATDIFGTGTASVGVVNPSPGGGASSLQRVTITPACSFTISPTSRLTNASGGTASVTVTTSSGCGWIASSNASWITISSGASGTGSGTVNYSVEANTATTPRAGTMTIAGQTFTVTQSGTGSNPSPIVTALSPTSVIAGGLGFTLTVTGSNFVPTSTVNWRTGQNAARPTTFVSSTQLTAQISATDISGGGTAAVSVTNPAPGGSTSSAVNLVIEPRPTVAEVEPNDLPSQATPIQVPNLINGAAAFGDWANLVYSANGDADPIEDLYAVTLTQTAQLDIRLLGNTQVDLDLFLLRDEGGVISFLQRSTSTAASERIVTPLMPPGRYLIGVSSLSGAGTYSLQVTNVDSNTSKTPTITNAILSSTLVVHGANFQSNSVVRINDVEAITTPISSTQLSAQVLNPTAVNRIKVVSPNQPAGADTSNEVSVFVNSANQRLVRVGSVFNTAPNAVKVPIELAAQGGESSVSFSLKFNKDLMTYRRVELAPGLNAILSEDLNRITLGLVGIRLTLPTGQSFLAGARPLLNASFTAAPGAGGSTTTLTFDDVPVARSSGFNFKTAAIAINQANVVPVLAGISPAAAMAGGESFTLTVNGANFAYNSVVRWQGSDRATTFLSPTQLTAAIPAGDIASVGTPAVTVFNPSPGGGESNARNFTINQSCNYVLQPAAQNFTADGGTGSFSVTVNSGCEWTATSNANWIGITSGSGSGSGTVDFAVEPNTNSNPRSGILSVGGQSFTVTQSGVVLNPPPTLSSISPASIAGSGPAFTLTVTGANFVPASAVQWNGGNRATTFVSSTQLTAQIPASDIATAGTVRITVFNPAPGGGRSIELPFTVTCGFAIQPASQAFTPAGGTGTVNVTAPIGCTWTASSNVSWIRVTSGASGSGPGTVGFAVDPNTGAARTGTMTIAGQTFTVSQDCTGTAILAQPAGQTVCAGAPVTFSVTAAGAGTLGFQWRKNGASIAGATGATYTIAAATAGDPGDYSVIVTGACGVVTSDVATLIVNTPPGITAQPANQTAPPGATATFTAAAAGNPAPTLQWQVSVDGVTFTNLAGATGTTLTLANLTLALNGNRYRAVFTNTCASVTSNVATLTVACPAIAVNPASLPEATVGLPYSQTFTASGGATPYSFSANSLIPGLGLTASGVLTGTPTQSGAFSFTLTVTDANGCTGSRNYTLTASCVYDIAPRSQGFTAGGGTGSVSVTTAGGCSWQAVSNAAWIRITSGIGGAGAGTVSFSVEANSGAARNGTLTIAGQTFTVMQGCIDTFIAAHPANQTVCAGAPVIFSVTATGATPINYQWQKNGVNIAGATGASFTIPAAAVTDAGNYSVAITGACSSLTSNIAALTVNTPPNITTQPGNQSIPPGATATFTAAAAGSPAPTVQWQISTDGVNFLDVPGATSVTLVVSNVQVSQTGSRYRAVFSNSCASVASNVAILSVACPAITINPAALPNGITGAPYSQTFTATGGVSPYSFSFNSNSPIPGLNFSANGSLTGTPAQGGVFSFTLTITDANGCSVSKNYSLTILCAYAIAPQSQDFPASGGTGSVALTTGNGCSWTAVSNVSWIRITSGSSGAGSGAVGYTVDANSGAARTGTITIAEQTFTVRQGCLDTAIAAHPASQTVCAGAPVIFSVTASGAGTVGYQWRKNGANIAGATSGSYLIPAASAGDAGDYSVIVTGACGSVTSNVATLSISTPPSLTTQPGNQTIAPGATAVFTASATGAPAPTVQWQVSADGINFSNVPGATSATLTINNAVLAQNGNRYRAVFTNSCGAAVSNVVTLTVACPAITLSPGSLANSTTGAVYSQLFTANGGAAPYSFGLSQQIPGLSLAANGPTAAMLAGTPTQSGAFSFTVTATDVNGCAVSRNYVLTIICAYDIAPRSQAFAASGGGGTAAVATGSNCTWSATSNVPWLTITAGESGTGSGPVVYAVAANSSLNPRTGTLTIAGQIFTVTQEGVPPNSRPVLTGLSPSEARVGGGAFALTVNGRDFVNGAVIRWNNSDRTTTFLSSTQVTALILPGDIANPGIATITVFNPAPGGGLSNALSFNVTLLICDYVVQPSEQTFASGGGTGTVGVTTSSDCSWTATSNVPWITITSGANNSGSGVVGYSVGPNTGPQRTGFLTIAGKTFTVTQGCIDTAITAQPLSQTICAGASVTFSATAVGAGTLGYQWRKNGVNISGATGSTYTLAAAGTGDAGSYSVVVTGACDSVTSSVATLAVNSPPGIITQPGSQTIAPGATATFSVSANGIPAPTVQWQFSTDGVNFANVPGGNGETLVVSNVTLAQNGHRYRAVFTNSCGTTTSNVVTLNVTCPNITIAPAILPNGSTGASYNQALSASGGATPYSFSISAGSLPPGVSLSAGGAFTGTPVQSGTFSFTVSVTDANGCIGNRAYTLAVGCVFDITPKSQGFPANGGADIVIVSTASGCGWTASSNANWIAITSGTLGSGNGQVSYSVSANADTNPRSGTLTIAGQTFTITQAGNTPNPVPVISGLNPSTVAAGSPTFTLTINGANFVPGAVVRLNGIDRQTVFLSAAQLTIQILATDIAAAGPLQITAVNPPPGGGNSATVTLTVLPALSGFTIAGRVTYADVGIVPVPGAVVTASSLGTDLSSPPTGGDGRYVIVGVARGTYGLRASKSGTINNITAFDAALILRQRINNEPFLGLQRKAADADGNDVVDERDALLIADSIVGKSGASRVGMWHLEVVNNATVDVTGNLPDQNFKAALIGDVSGKWSPNTSLAIIAVTPVTLNLKNTASGSAVNLPGVTISGTGFTPDLALVVTFPDGGQMKLSGAQLVAASPESFTAALPLNERGLWTFRILAADGQMSDAFVVKVE